MPEFPVTEHFYSVLGKFKRGSVEPLSNSAAGKILIFDLTILNERSSQTISESRISDLSDVPKKNGSVCKLYTIYIWWKNEVSWVTLVFYTLFRVCSFVSLRKCLKRCRNIFSTKSGDRFIHPAPYINRYYQYTDKHFDWLKWGLFNIFTITMPDHVIPN